MDRMDRMDRMERRYSEARIPDLRPPRRVEAIKACIQNFAKWAFDSVEIYAFGSSVNGFGDDSSDVDLVVSIPEEELRRIWKKTPRRDLARFALQDLSEWFREKAQGQIDVLEEVLGAKVPILKLNVGGVECDLSCNNLLPVFNSQLLRLYADKDPRVVQLAQEVKSWARKEGVHGAFMGQLSSYSFVLLTIFYMQNRGALPCLQKAAIGEPSELYYYERNKEFNVWMNFDAEPAPGDMAGKAVGTLSDFAWFMTQEKGFVWGEHVVSVREGCILSLDDFPQLSIRHVIDDVTLHIEDPFDVSRNLTCVFGHNANRNLWWALDRLARANASPSGELRSFTFETDETSPVERQQTPDDRDECTRVFAQPSTYTPDIQESAEETSSNFPPVQSRTAAEEWLEQGKRLKEDIISAADQAAIAREKRGKSVGLVLPLPKRGVNLGSERCRKSTEAPDGDSQHLTPSNPQTLEVAVTIAASPSSSSNKTHVALSVAPTPTNTLQETTSEADFFSAKSGHWSGPYVAIQVGTPKCSPGRGEEHCASPTATGTPSSEGEENFWKCLVGTSPMRSRMGVSRASTERSTPSGSPSKVALI